jgi:hypothetical protein
MRHHEYNDLLNRADCVPALFTVSDALNEGNAEWIVENELRRLKVDAMFGTVGFVLYLVPLKPHLYLQYRTYSRRCPGAR